MWGASTQFSLTPVSDCNGKTIMLIKDWKDLVTSVGDNQRLLQSLKDSPYFGAFADKATIWEGKLATLTEELELLNIIQRKWVYLVRFPGVAAFRMFYFSESLFIAVYFRSPFLVAVHCPTNNDASSRFLFFP